MVMKVLDFIGFYRYEFLLSPSPFTEIIDRTNALSFVKDVLHIWQLNARMNFVR